MDEDLVTKPDINTNQGHKKSVSFRDPKHGTIAWVVREVAPEVVREVVHEVVHDR